MDRSYICIDLKSFYASVECVDRGLDPMTTNLVVADPERTEKTICLAITPAMKKLGIPNRCRVFQIPEHVKYIMAPPRMQHYIDVSADIYSIYLKYIAKEDIHVYSIDEVFMDVTDYLNLYQVDAKELGQTIMQDILQATGITASCGIGTNLYLAKIAMDITAKHSENHIGILDEENYRRTLWKHRPITDFWRIGPGIANRLKQYGIYTMEEVAKADESMLYKIFGVDAELLIDHAWGRETTTMEDIKNYKPSTNCLTSGQVLACDYSYEQGKLVVKEMADMLCLDLVEKSLVTKSITLYVGYANSMNLEAAKGSISLQTETSSARMILPQVERLYERIVTQKWALIHRINISFNNVTKEEYLQYDLFDSPQEREKERSMQKAMLDIKKRYGKNAVLKGMNLEEGATARERNRQIGGHKSGE
ncbi:MAG: DNA repair protein [Lachnospiraceae bacterium]|nr:DNA repair protein [Lachnospiraceae bacterium]